MVAKIIEWQRNSSTYTIAVEMADGEQTVIHTDVAGWIAVQKQEFESELLDLGYDGASHGW